MLDLKITVDPELDTASDEAILGLVRPILGKRAVVDDWRPIVLQRLSSDFLFSIDECRWQSGRFRSITADGWEVKIPSLNGYGTGRFVESGSHTATGGGAFILSPRFSVKLIKREQ